MIRAALAAALAALALPAAAAPGSLLEITIGPHETSWLRLKEVEAQLDGVPLPVAVPATAEPSQTVYSDVVVPGHHRLELKVGFTGDSKAFAYLEGYVFRMQGQLELDAPPAEAVGVTARVVDVSGVTVQWTDRFKLTLQATRYQSDRAAAAQLPDPEPAPVAEPEPPAPPPAPVEPTLAPCALEPPRFAVARYDLDAAGRASLDRFAACLVERGEPAVIEGHTDPRGGDAYNERLAERRAQEAARYLEGRGVAAGRLTVRAAGSTSPVCTEATEVCNAQNRRVEAVVGPP